jgi:hypothetical protein
MKPTKSTSHSLAPCPFCGSKPYILTTKANNSKYTEYFISCTTDECVFDTSAGFDNLSHLKLRWNTRTSTLEEIFNMEESNAVF